MTSYFQQYIDGEIDESRYNELKRADCLKRLESILNLIESEASASAANDKEVFVAAQESIREFVKEAEFLLKRL